MYNFVLAFVICAVVYIIGEVVATVTKAPGSVRIRHRGGTADRILDCYPKNSSQ